MACFKVIQNGRSLHSYVRDLAFRTSRFQPLAVEDFTI